MVEGREYIIEYYRSPNGAEPFREWRNALRDIQARAIVDRRIRRLQIGLFGDCESINDGVHELRIDVGKGYRVYFGNAGENIILLLVGGNKKTQPKDIKLAKEFWNEHKKRR